MLGEQAGKRNLVNLQEALLETAGNWAESGVTIRSMQQRPLLGHTHCYPALCFSHKGPSSGAMEAVPST